MTDMIGVRLTPENQSALTTLQEQEPVVIDEIVNRALSSYFFALKFAAFRARLIKPQRVSQSTQKKNSSPSLVKLNHLASLAGWQSRCPRPVPPNGCLHRCL